MRILVLCKRFYTGRDLVDDAYGRLYEIPRALAAMGHEVWVVATAYRPAPQRNVHAERFTLQGVGLVGSRAASMAASRRLRPDVVLASSDVIQLLEGVRLARRINVPVVLDLYDDYEAFGLARMPGMVRALRRACASADATIAVSSTLAAILPTRGPLRRPPVVVRNGVLDWPEWHVSVSAARKHLGLPAEARIMGTAGALDRSRGIDDLFSAFLQMRSQCPDLCLAVAGPGDARRRGALPPDAIDLGILPHREARLLLRALDVGVVCNRDSAFGRSCHPQKLVELVSARTPVVAAAIGEVRTLLAPWPSMQYPPGDPSALAAASKKQLDEPLRAPGTLAQSWTSLAGQVDDVLRMAETGS